MKWRSHLSTRTLIFKYGYGFNIACSSLNQSNESALFGVHYALGVDAHTNENFRRLKLVMLQIRRAALLQNRPRISIVRESRLAAAVDAISMGIVLVDRDATVVHVNLAAKRLLTKERGVSITDRRVRIAQPNRDRELERIILKTTRQHPVSGGAAGEISIDSATSSPCLNILVFAVPLRVTLEDALGAILIVSDPQSRVSSTSLDFIRALFDFTSAESQLVLALSNGETLASYAKRTGKSIETVRDQLKSTMGKMGVNSKSELVRLTPNTVGPLLEIDK